MTGICVVSGGINNAAAVQPVPSTDPRVLEVLRGWDGLPQTNGPLCVEPTRCFARAEGRLLEARFTGFWVDPKAGMKVAQKQIILRRTRW